MNKTTVYVVDDDKAMCESLRWLIESVNMPVETFISAHDFLEHYDASSHGCLVLDMRMPTMSGFELQEELSNNAIKVPIIFITGYGDIPMAVRAMKNGAIDFITKPFNDQELLDSINKAIKKDAERFACDGELNHLQGIINKLTPRELEVAKLIVSGNSNKLIAKILQISPKTVEVHRAKVMTKTGMSSLADLVTLFIKVG